MTAQPKSADIEASTPIAGQKMINLALQGGGSHGAFTWGVLDRLLEDERIAFDGVTATSAGGVNAVVLADGLALNGREGAQRAAAELLEKDVGGGLLELYRTVLPRSVESEFRPR